MDLFNDIDFGNNSELTNSIMRTTVPTEIGQLLIKKLGTERYQFPVVQDHYLLILDDEPQHCTGQYKTREGDILPYTYNMLSCLFSFNESFTHLNYIQVYPAQYENNDIVVDDDACAIPFANMLFNEYDMITDKIIYELKDKRKRFVIQTSNKRQITSTDDKLTLKFVQKFPQIVNQGLSQLANNVYIRQCQFESEKCLVELFKQLIKQFKYVLFNTASCYIDGVPFYMYDKCNNDFFKAIIENADMVDDIDQYAVIDKRIINILNKYQQKHMNENLFDDVLWDDTDNTSEIINNQLLPVEEYLLNFFITHNNEDYQYEIYQPYLIVKSKLLKNNGEFKTPDNDIIPIAVDDIYCIIKFDTKYKNIDYIIFNKCNEINWVTIKLPLFTLQIDLYEQFKVRIKSIYISTNSKFKTLLYGNKDIIATQTRNSFIENINIPENAYENISSKILKIGIPKFLTASGEYIDNISVTTLRFNNISICFSFLKQLYIHTKDGFVSVDTMNGIKIKDKNFINNKKIKDDYILNQLFYTNKRWFTLDSNFFERLKQNNILKENINIHKYKKYMLEGLFDDIDIDVDNDLSKNIIKAIQTLKESKGSLYNSLIESIAVSVKRSLNEDRDDHAHNAPSSYLKQRLSSVLKNKFGYAPLPSKNARIGRRDILIRNRNNVPGYPSNFSVAVAERTKKNDDNFRIPISRKGEMDILSDDNIKYVLFPRYIGTSNIDYIVYIVDKEDIQKIYDNLNSTLQRCKDEIKQGKRDRKTIKVNKSISDKWKNFLAPTAGNDGVCLSNNCLKELAVDTFKLYDKSY